MNILITGAAGYIGSYLCNYLKQNTNHTIIGYDNFYYDQGVLVYPALKNIDKFYVEDVTQWSSNLINDIKTSDVIIPLAAIVGAPCCDKVPSLATLINYTWFEKLLDVINKDTYILYPNTNSGYGSTGSEICTESTPSNPISLYGKLKQDTEYLLTKNCNFITCFRLATVFGWSFRPRLDLLINNLVYKSKTDGVIDIFDAHFRRNYIHVEDISRAFCMFIDLWENKKHNVNKEVYNLGNDNINSTKFDLAKTISETLDTKFNVVSNRTDPDKRDYIVSSEKLYKLGFQCTRDLISGIKELNYFYNYINFNRYKDIICNY